jgi:hypothetical protein
MAMSQTVTQKSMELEGNLSAFQLPDLLRFLAMGRMTGVLSLTDGRRTIELTIHEGKVVGTATPERFLKLGELLVYNGYLNRRDLEEVLQSQKESHSGRRIGEMLIERRLVTSEQVGEQLLLQVKEEIFELFGWRDGGFKFEHGPAPSGDRALLTLEIEPLIEEGRQRLSQWQTLERSFRNGSELYRVRNDLAGFPECRLSPAAWKVLALINGRRTLKDLVFLAGMGKFETINALDQLLSVS